MWHVWRMVMLGPGTGGGGGGWLGLMVCRCGGHSTVELAVGRHFILWETGSPKVL